MPSPAAEKHATDRSCANVLRTAGRLYPRSSVRERQILYGASLVAGVAAWDAYVNGVVRDFFHATATPLIPSASAHHLLAKGMADSLLKKFNVPNSENVRNLLVAATGFDPWPNWRWPQQALSPLAVRGRLNEILKVRHSVAHGFSLPAFPWTTGPRGTPRLTAQMALWTDAFLANLVRQTDQGITQHLMSVYSITPPW